MSNNKVNIRVSTCQSTGRPRAARGSCRAVGAAAAGAAPRPPAPSALRRPRPRARSRRMRPARGAAPRTQRLRRSESYVRCLFTGLTDILYILVFAH